MAFTPNSTVYLLDTPLDNTYKNTLHFESKTEQYNYFLSCLKHSFEGVTYQRKDNSIRVNKNIDALWNSNYVMYQNENFSSKWFYAFITKMEYVSANVTDIFIETDVYQTWLFDTKLKKSFVVREHVKDDTIGSNLVDEQLETGEYIMKAYIPSNKLGANWNILAVSDTTPLGGTAEVGNIYGNVVTGLAYFPFPNTDLGVQWLRTVIDLYTTAGKSDAIVMIFTIPEMLLDSIPESWSIGQPIPSNTLPAVKVAVLDKVKSNLDGYVPKNNKMFTFPYNFLYVSNNSGLSATYRYEYFPTDTANFSIFGVISPSPKLMLAPMDYKGEGLKYEYGLTLQGFPMCSWTTDSYTAWLAQNELSNAVTMIGSGVAIVGGIATANPMVVAGGVLGVAHQLTQIHQASIQPDQAKGQSGNGSLMFSSDVLDFYFSPMTISHEFAKRIDDFFTMYGYKVNTLKLPETHSRRYWNYIKTIDVNIDGSIPDDDMRRLKQIYNDGVTLWHSPENYLNYDLTNNIL